MTAHHWWQKLAGGDWLRVLNGLLWVAIHRHFTVLTPVSNSPWKRPCDNWPLLKHLLLVCIQLETKPTVLLQCKHSLLQKKPNTTTTPTTILTLKPRAIRSQSKPKYTLNSFGFKLNKKLNYKHVRSPCLLLTDSFLAPGHALDLCTVLFWWFCWLCFQYWIFNWRGKKKIINTIAHNSNKVQATGARYWLVVSDFGKAFTAALIICHRKKDHAFLV